MTVGVFDTCGDNISIYGGIEYTTSWLLTVGISLTEVKANELPKLVTADCPPGFRELLWERGLIFSRHYWKDV